MSRAASSRVQELLGHNTPGKLRSARALVVVVLVVSFVVGVYAARRRVDIVHGIETSTEPLNADAIEVYRRLADADATVAAEFLTQADVDVQAARTRYDADLKQAATSLAHAGTWPVNPARDQANNRDRPSRGVYSGLVERARTTGELGHTPGADLRQAPDLMRSTVLRLSGTLQ